MEREEIFGAIIVLIIILVIALIIYNMHGSAGEDIRRIADEVFGWAKGEQKLEEERLGQKDAQKFIDQLVEIHKKSLTSGKTDCTYDLRGYDLPEKYKVEIVYLNSQDGIMKFNLINIEDERIISTKTLEKEQTEWKLEPCFMEETTKRVRGGDRIEITYTAKEGLKAGTNKFYEDLPKLYKYDKNHLCFITQTKKNEKEYKKHFLDLSDCETDKTKGAEKAMDFFTTFIASVRTCKSFAKGEACYCEPIDFSPMPQGAEIRGTQESEMVKFELYYNNQHVTEEKIPDTKAGDLTAGFFERKPTYRGWTTELRRFNKESKLLYIALTEYNQLSFATERAVKEGLIRRWAESLPQCKPEFYEVFEKGCTRELDPTLVMKRIKDNKYDEIIKQTTQDECERELIAAIMATESSGINGRVSTGNCAGLMQFCPSTAKGFAVTYKEKTSYVCDPKGCQVQDNREKPEIAIPAALKLLNDKIKYIDKCPNYLGEQKQYSYREIFGIVAYNGGEDILCKAIKATKKEDPSWEDVKKELNVNLLKSSKGYSNDRYWSEERLKGKVKEIKCYAYYVNEYRKSYRGNFA